MHNKKRPDRPDSAGITKFRNTEQALLNESARSKLLRSIFMPSEQLMANFHSKLSSQQRASHFHQWLNEWVQRAQTDAARQVAQQLADQVQYIPFGEFMNSFNKGVRSLRRAMAAAQEWLVPQYLLVLNHDFENTDWLKKKRKVSPDNHHYPKSTDWLAPYAAHTLGSTGFQGTIIKDNQELKIRSLLPIQNVPVLDIVLVDDAAYSGLQIMSTIHSLSAILKNSMFPGQTARVWVMVPYMTQQAILRIRDMSVRDSRRIHVNVMSPIVIMDSSKAIFDKLHIKFRGLPYPAALTVFEHKFPDKVSFPEHLTKGCPLQQTEGYFAFDGRCARESDHALYAPGYYPEDKPYEASTRMNAYARDLSARHAERGPWFKHQISNWKSNSDEEND